MEKKHFIGIDISKKTLDAVIYVPNKKHSDASNYRRFSNDGKGFHAFLSWLKEKRVPSKAAVVGMENTGVYGFDLRLFLEKKEIDYCCFMPLHLKLSFGLARGKNDRVDAERIAHYTALHKDELVFSKLAGSTVLRLQELSTERKHFVVQRAGYEALLTDSKDRKQTATHARARRMKEILDEEIAAVEKEMEQLVESDPGLARNYKLLLSIKGIGLTNAISTLVHTDNFRAFETARQYACYLGIAPFDHSSGTSVKGSTKVSHIGAKGLKADLSQAANSAIVWDKELKEYYERKRKEGKAYGVVLNAVKFKLVCRMFAVVRRGTPFVSLQTYKS